MIKKFIKKAFKSVVNVVKKVVKAVAPIALAVAIPFAAPYVAGALSLTSAFGATIGTAIAGAGLGAASAALQGQNIGRGALFGGISSGLGAYTGTTGVGSAGDNAVRNFFGAGDVGAGLTVQAPATTFSSGSLLDGTASGIGSGAASAVDPFALSSSGFGASVPTASGFGNFTGAGAGASASGLDLSGALAGTTTPSAIGAMGAANGLGVAAAPSAGSSFTLGASGGSGSFLDAVKSVPSTIANRVSDPKFLADLTLRAGSQLLGGVFAGDGLSEEEQAILNQQTEELKQLKDTNFALFQEKLNNARNLIGEARYFDPEYMGLQSARQQQLAGARAKSAGLRGLNDERRQSEERRYDLATARDTGTAYDQGYGTGINSRLKTIEAGINAYPNDLKGTDGYAALLQSYGIEDDRKAKKEAQIGSFFKGLFDPEESRRQSDPGAF